MLRMIRWMTASRRRVVLVALALLLILDLGRSAYARVGYARPTEPWQPAPYEPLDWPPGAGLPEDATVGERVYAERCAICHGADGRGNGAAAPSMIPRPRDFTTGQYKYSSSPLGQLPSQQNVIAIINGGLPASAMPYFGDILTQPEIAAVADYVLGFSVGRDQLTGEDIRIPEPRPADAGSLARGGALYREQGCLACHGEDGRAQLELVDQKGYPVIARDLTAPWTFRGGSEPESLYLRITTGMAPGPMPAYDSLSPDDRWDIVNFLRSRYRIPPWEAGGQLSGRGAASDPVARGAYLVRAEMCGLCHTQVDDTMIYSGDEYYLAGGMGIPAYPQGTFVSLNLTSDLETGLGSWTVDEIADAIRNGRGRDRDLNLWGMPWMFLHSFTEPDAIAIASYLKTLPPVQNKVPLPLKYGFLETMIAKAVFSTGVPPIGNPNELIYKAGNYGQTNSGLLPRDWPQRLLVASQLLVVFGGAAVFFAVTPAGKRWPRSARGRVKTSLGLAGIALLAFLLWVVYSTPVLPFVPPEQINMAVTSGIQSPERDQFESPELAALAERGEYLYTVTSCAFCHGSVGEGGAKINAPAFGTLWARNISSDPETGIGSWSAAEIARAIRSGISADGTQLHWQGMIWDHLSNLEEEDVRALVVYLRTLPPVQNSVPVSVPPGPDDCPEYRFFLVESSTPGCTP